MTCDAEYVSVFLWWWHFFERPFIHIFNAERQLAIFCLLKCLHGNHRYHFKTILFFLKLNKRYGNASSSVTGSLRLHKCDSEVTGCKIHCSLSFLTGVKENQGGYWMSQGATKDKPTPIPLQIVIFIFYFFKSNSKLIIILHTHNSVCKIHYGIR